MKTHPRTLWHRLGGLLDPAGTCSDQAMAAPDLDWRGLYRLAAHHLVAPALYAALAGRGRLAAVPGEVREALAALHALNDARNRRLRGILRETVQVLNRVGIEPILLKGAIALLPGQYPRAFARMMNDLDLAVAPAEAERAGAALCTAGYYGAPHLDC